MASQSDPTDLPPNAAQLREQLVAATQTFFDSHGIRVKSRKLPVPLPATSPPAPVSSRAEGSGSARKASGRAQTECAGQAGEGLSAACPVPLPLYHFITRQKFHMAEQLIRNRSSYLTPHNKKLDRRQRASPWIMQEMTDEVKKHLAQMSSDFDDQEFSGVYISLHTVPYLVDCDYGNLVRSRLVGWALVELLTTNERCLKALWVHPSLSASSTRLVLQAFLPRILVEAIEFNTPGVKPLCPWRFFYCWLNDFDLMPRGSWLLLSAPKYLGLPVHCDNLNMEEDEEAKEETKAKGGGCKGSGGGKGRGRPPSVRTEKAKRKKKEEEEELHVGHRDGDVGCACPCQHPSRWHEDFDERLVGCTESFIYRNFGRILELVPKGVDARLQDEIAALPHENPETAKKEPPESDEEIRVAETFGLDNETISRLLQKVYGPWNVGRFKYADGDAAEDTRPLSRRRLSVPKHSSNREVLTMPE